MPYLEDYWTVEVATPALLGTCLWALLRVLMSMFLTHRAARRRWRFGLRARMASVLSCSAALLTATPAFSAGHASTPRRPAEPPWSRTSGFPPLRPLVPTRASERPLSGVVNVRGMGVDASYRSLQEEGGDRGGELLLPSGGGTAGEPPPPKASQAEAEDSKEICGRHEVVAGDSLWTIASRVLDTDDPRRIARYWPRLHRANRGLIGSNPDLIRPGWVLTLPGECD